jgi:CMP-N,N'-diacetyllegionaminic acid synthase
MNILAVIPARGGSKKLPRKNILPIAGEPLISYTIREGLKVQEITHLIVSTDDLEIAEVSRSYGALVPFIRPSALATDEAQSAPVLYHSLIEMESLHRITYDAVMMLQPTSPLRREEHIRSAIKLLESNVCDSVVSVVSVGGNHPFRMKRMIGDRLINLIDQGYEDMRPRQHLPPVYIRNGAIYLTRRNIVAEQKQIVGRDCFGMKMESEDSINIDDRYDFLLAELMLAERRTNV